MQAHLSERVATNEALSKRKLHSEGKAAEQMRICSEYIIRERDFENEESKAPERELIAEFFLKNHANGEKIRLMSLPSIHWTFENLLIKKSPERDYRFFGFEWTWGVIELGRPYMPGKGKLIGHEVYLNIGKIRGFIKDQFNDGPGISSHWLWVSLSSFVSIEDQEKKHPKSFARVYKRMTAIWLDFTSQLCAEVRKTLIKCGEHCHPEKDIVPVAVTVMAARDCHDDDADRAQEIAELLGAGDRDFLPEFHRSYVNNGIPMLNVAGILIKR